MIRGNLVGGESEEYNDAAQPLQPFLPIDKRGRESPAPFVSASIRKSYGNGTRVNVPSPNLFDPPTGTDFDWVA